MYTIRKYSDGTTEVGRKGGHFNAAETHVIRRPVNMLSVCLLVIVVAIVLYYRLVILRHMKYDGFWVLEPSKRIVELRTNLFGKIHILDTNNGQVGSACWKGGHLEVFIDGEKSILATHNQLMVGNSIKLRRVNRNN